MIKKNGHRMLCPFFFIWNKVKYAILEKGSYIEKWSDSNEQNRGMQGGYYAACRY